MVNWLNRSAKRYYRNIRRTIRGIKYNNQLRRQSGTIFEDSIDTKKEYHLFITNDNFGGTRQYEKNVVATGKNIILLRRLSYGEREDIIYEVTNVDQDQKFLMKLGSLGKIFSMTYNQITINTLVHITSIREVFSFLIEYKKKNPACYFLYLVHDFHSVCLNCNLYANGHYCGLKCEVENCELRLADRKVSISKWRNLWKEFFKYVDEVRCFSLSSKQIIHQVYPEIEDKKMSVVPHDLSFISFSHIEGIDNLPLHLGFIGDCNADIKGRPIAREIIKRYGNEIPISMVGSSYRFYRIRRKKVKYTGRYQHDNLQKIIEQEKITVVVFPSLWPETFSYLISEIIAMDIPIICFNFGAQAEKVGAYYKGTVCHNINEMYDHIDKLINNERNIN